jgi:radical SAM superfamily enzyme YgiQ (UPF0313 family)
MATRPRSVAGDLCLPGILGVSVNYHGNVIRPPSEAGSLILQVMHGCSHGACSFCGSYLGKPFRVRPFTEIERDIRQLPAYTKDNVEKVFLCDGDALALPARRVLKVLDLLRAELPSLGRVSAYANAHSLLRLSAKELREIRAHGLELLYLGLESGDEQTLSEIGKGVSVTQQIAACHRAKDAGLALSVTAILGLAGVARSAQHALATGKALSAIDPHYIGILSLMLEPGTPVAERALRGDFVMPGSLSLLLELRQMIAEITVTHALFRTNHASNYLSLKGTLPRDKEALLRALEQTLAAGHAVRLRPESLRAL